MARRPTQKVGDGHSLLAGGVSIRADEPRNKMVAINGREAITLVL